MILLCQGRRHDFGIGGAVLKVGRKMCAHLRASKFLTTSTSTYPRPLIAHNCYNIIECCCYLDLPQLWNVITNINNYDVD